MDCTIFTNHHLFMKTKLFFLSAAVIGTLSSCLSDKVDSELMSYSKEELLEIQKHLNLPEGVDDYTLNLPKNLSSFPIQVNNKQATLGRVLFYDKRLSSNKEVNCATCHLPEKAFTDGEQFSQGVAEERTSRNTLALGSFPSFNAYYGFGGTRMFWDNRASSVMEQSAETMKNPVEMGNTDLGEVADELLQERFYQILFDKAFHNEGNMSNEDKMLTALQAFVSSIGCYQTRYDYALTKSDDKPESDFTKYGFTKEENLGKQLFNDNCASCHNLGAGFATTIVAANNGLDLNYSDEGISAITNQSTDEGQFKVPMLRNIELTGPYMHDGRFKTLEAVIEHYNSGVKSHPNLHPNLKNSVGNPKKLNLTEEEKQAMVAFLKTLTDKESLALGRYSDPFKH